MRVLCRIHVSVGHSLVARLSRQHLYRRPFQARQLALLYGAPAHHWPERQPSFPCSPPAHRSGRRPGRLSYGLSWGLLCLAALWWLYPPVFLVEVQGRSMNPTYVTGQFLVATPIGHVKRGDVIIAQTDEGTIIKRIAYVGGTQVPAPKGWVNYTNPYNMFVNPGEVGERWRDRVPAGTVYLLGDNRESSEDSREFGPIPMRDIKGKVFSRLSMPRL